MPPQGQQDHKDAFQDMFVEERLYDNMVTLSTQIDMYPWDFKKMTMKDREKIQVIQQRMKVFTNALYKAHQAYLDRVEHQK